MPDQRVDGALGGRVGGRFPTAARAAREDVKITLEPSLRIGSSCCTRKYGARTLTANSASKSSTVVSSIVAAFRDAGIGNRMSSRSPTISRTLEASLWAP